MRGRRWVAWSALALLPGCGGAATATLRLAPPPAEPVALTEPPPADWPMFRDDLERTGFAEGSHVGASAHVLWAVSDFNTTGYGAVKGSPAIADGVLYCGTDTGRLVSVRVDDGRVLWEVDIAGTTHGVHGTPAVVKDVVYVGAYDGALYAFARGTGALLWRYALGYQVGSSPAVVSAWNTVFSAHERADGAGYVVALDARTGEPLWRADTDAHPHASVAVDVGKDAVFAADNHGVVYRFDRRTGEVTWRTSLEAAGGKADVKTTPTVLADLGLLVVTAWTGRAVALRESDGTVVWEHEVGGRPMGSAAYDADAGAVFVGSPRGMMHALDARTGEERWVFHAGGRVFSSPAVSGDGATVVFGASDGKLYAVDAGSGAERWSVWLGGQLTGSPSLVGSRIYVTGKRGALWALETG